MSLYQHLQPSKTTSSFKWALPFPFRSHDFSRENVFLFLPCYYVITYEYLHTYPIQHLKYVHTGHVSMYLIDDAVHRPYSTTNYGSLTSVFYKLKKPLCLNAAMTLWTRGNRCYTVFGLFFSYFAHQDGRKEGKDGGSIEYEHTYSMTYRPLPST